MLKRFAHWALVLAGSLPLVPISPAMAQPVGAKVPMADFFRLGQFGSVALNPGKEGRTHVAFIREVNGRHNLLVLDMATKEIKNVAGYDNADVVDFEWINHQRLLYRVADLRIGVGDSYKFGVFAIDRDGTKPLTMSEGLASYGGVGNTGNRGLPARGQFYRRARSGDNNDFVVAQYAQAPDRLTLMRVNSRDGSRKPIEIGGLTNALEWALDANDVPRAAVTFTNLKRTMYTRDGTGQPWRKVAEMDLEDPKTISPLRIDGKGKMYVSARVGSSDFSAIHVWDWEKGQPQPEPLVVLKGFDVEDGASLRFDAVTDELIGVDYVAETPGTYWISPQGKALQEIVDNALKGRINQISGSFDGMMVVTSYSDVSPARYYLLDSKAKRLSLLGASRPWIDDKTQAQTDFLRYTARDGLSIPAYLTLPRGVEAKSLPLVLLIHGGPYVRGVTSTWYRDRQFLASRGYAVLEPEYRGSTGFGWQHFRAGWKQWGLAMQDDMADGVAELVKRGVVDKNRVCIAGASYGGYATVMGLIRHPEVYKCGISWVGVTDIELMYTVGWSDTADSEWARYGMPVLVGDRTKDAQQLRDTSAITQAARLKAPLLMAYGVEDVRVPYDHGQKLRDALKPHNPNVQYVEYPGEGHGWRLLETNIDFWTRAEKLLQQTIGGGAAR